MASLDKWDEYTEAKEATLFYTDTADALWTLIKSNDKKRARVEAMRYVLSLFDYPGKDPEIVGTPDPKIVGSRPVDLRTRRARAFPTAELPESDEVSSAVGTPTTS
ncbi:hypothetical protein ACTXG6_33575 [Pseudonocardia sp. Cha107L01]|uniref:hypothetical protein n=1 Tax=Pseudonocardia sp. Cha107L01 TaxID=3457576 RepID=UPI00403E8FA0